MTFRLSFFKKILATPLILTFLLQPALANEKKNRVSILFAGDIVLDGTPGKLIAEGKDPLAPFSDIINTTDIRVANLECVVATSGRAADKNFTFRAAPKTLATLRRHFDAVSIANNHSGDFGHEAFTEMLGHLDQYQVKYFGGGRNLREAHAPLLIEKNGLKIALLGYNEFMPRSFEATASTAGVAWSEDEQVVADIRKARTESGADLVIPFMHWGWENDKHSTIRQQQLAHLMIDAGADAVIGGHPHVIQETEQYKGKPIIYSLGNFVIDELDNEPQTRGWIVRLELNKSGVEAWDTRLAKINQNGIPIPVPGAATPCWNKESTSSKLCGNAKSGFITNRP